MCCVPARRNSRISWLTWASYLCSSSLLCRRFEIPSHSLGSCTSHTTQQKGKDREGREGSGKGRSSKPTESHLSPPSASRVPASCHYLSVKSQVTTLLAEPSEGRHFISHLPACLASKKSERLKKKTSRKVIHCRKA